MGDEPSNTRRRWPQVSLRTILFLLVPYAATLIWIWTWGMRLGDEYPYDFVWVAEFKRHFGRAFLRLAQVESTIQATVVFAALAFLPKMIRWIARNRTQASKEPPFGKP